MDETKTNPTANQYAKVHLGSYCICCNYQLGGIEAVDSELNQLILITVDMDMTVYYKCWPGS